MAFRLSLGNSPEKLWVFPQGSLTVLIQTADKGFRESSQTSSFWYKHSTQLIFTAKKVKKKKKNYCELTIHANLTKNQVNVSDP